jgi:hypothetical protein
VKHSNLLVPKSGWLIPEKLILWAHVCDIKSSQIEGGSHIDHFQSHLIRPFLKAYIISAHADGGPHSRVCAWETTRKINSLKIVATFVYASSQGQRTHSAWTNFLDSMTEQESTQTFTPASIHPCKRSTLQEFTPANRVFRTDLAVGGDPWGGTTA